MNDRGFHQPTSPNPALLNVSYQCVFWSFVRLG
jgi:hypothetical protein